MSTNQIKELYAEWKQISAIPRNLDARSRKIRELASKNEAGWDILDCPDFGRIMAMRLVGADQPCRLLEKPPYVWLRKMTELIMVMGKTPILDSDVQVVFEAMELRRSPGVQQSLLHAALLASDATADTVASALGMAEPVVDAYNTLFFDVLDRKTDAGYRQTAMKEALMPRGDLFAAKYLNPPMASLLVAGLCGTLADVMEAAESMGWASAA